MAKLDPERLSRLQQAAATVAASNVRCAAPNCDLYSTDSRPPSGWRCRFHERPDHPAGSLMGCQPAANLHFCPVHSLAEVRKALGREE